jgi:hypothetical protein
MVRGVARHVAAVLKAHEEDVEALLEDPGGME